MGSFLSALPSIIKGIQLLKEIVVGIMSYIDYRKLTNTVKRDNKEIDQDLKKLTEKSKIVSDIIEKGDKPTLKQLEERDVAARDFYNNFNM